MIGISILAIILYVLAAYKLANRLFSKKETINQSSKIQAFVLGFVALVLHSIVLLESVKIQSGLNFGFYNALSLMGWGISFIVLLLALGKPLENLAIIFFPLTAICLGLEIIFPSSRILSDTAPMGLRMHVLLSIFAYCLLAIAVLQAMVLALQDRQISKKHPSSILRLPPMQVMETLLIQIISIGFFMLSLSLATGLMFLHDIFAQHLVHKVVLSILDWIIFGTILWGHWTAGWRGKKLISWTIGGFICLMLAYFGSKLVLELILHRV